MNNEKRFILYFISGILGLTSRCLAVDFPRFSPEAIQLNLPEKVICTRELLIANPGPQSAYYKIQPEVWYPESMRDSCSEWLDVQPRAVTVSAGASQIITLKIQVPKQMHGECLTMLFFSQAALPGTIEISTRFSVPLYLNHQGTELMDGKIHAIEIEKFGKSEKGSALRIRVKNTGTIHMVPFGYAEIESLTLHEKVRVEIKFHEPIFPGLELEMSVPFSPRLKSGNYKIESVLLAGNLYTDEMGRESLKRLAGHFLAVIP